MRSSLLKRDEPFTSIASENYSSSNESLDMVKPGSSLDRHVVVKARSLSPPASCDIENSYGSFESGSLKETSEIKIDLNELERKKKINCIKGQAYKMQQYVNSVKVVNTSVDQEQVEWTASMW